MSLIQGVDDIFSLDNIRIFGKHSNKMIFVCPP